MVRSAISPTRYTGPVPYQELNHTADAGVVVEGSSAEETLARLVLAFGDLLSGGAPVAEDQDVTLEVEAGDRAVMAVDVLRELLFLFDSKARVPASCSVVRFDPASGCAVVVGTGPYDAQVHAEGLAFKAVTLHEARFEPRGGGWYARIVFDV